MSPNLLDKNQRILKITRRTSPKHSLSNVDQYSTIPITCSLCYYCRSGNFSQLPMMSRKSQIYKKKFIVPFQSFADISHAGVVERDVQCVQSLHASWWICRSLWQQSVVISFGTSSITDCNNITTKITSVTSLSGKTGVITGRLPWQPAGIKFTQCVSS